MNSGDKVREWLHRHDIRILDDNKRRAVSRHINNYFVNASDYNEMSKLNIPYHSEKVFTVELTESELEKLASFENEVFNHMKSHGHYNLFEYLMEQKEREKELRSKYPAVQKAYEQYSMMLKLAQSGEL